MDDKDTIRRVVLNLLIESALRFSILSRYFRGEFLGSAFSDLGAERLGLIQRAFSLHPDEALAESLQGPDSTGFEVVFEQVRAVADQGEAFAADVAIHADSSLVAVLAEMPKGILDEGLRTDIMAAIEAGLTRLRDARDRARSTGRTLTFSTKSQGGGQEAPPLPVYEVWFGTNREPVEEHGELVGFSAVTAERLTYGKCGVSIPKTHRIGDSKPSFWRRLVHGDRPLSLDEVSPLEEPAFWSSVAQSLRADGAGPGDAIVFLHGFNVSFEAAAICAAQIGADLNVPGGAMAFFSWPSHGRVLGYLADEASIEASEVQITSFLEDFVVKAGARRVHLIAHSMGNRGLLRAVNRIATNAVAGAGKPFGQIILAAPDVDRRTFEMLHKAYAAVAERTTLYVSSKDHAVRSSRGLHAMDRVGLTPPVTVLPHIDTVSVTKVDLSFLGHGYVAGCRPVLTDIHQLLVSDIEPGRRAGLSLLSTPAGPYWEIAA